MMKGMKDSSTEKEQSQLGFGKHPFVVDETDGGSFSKVDLVRKLPSRDPSISERQSAKGKPAHVQCSSEQVGYKSLNSKCNETKLTYIVTLLLCKWILMDMIDKPTSRGNTVRTL